MLQTDVDSSIKGKQWPLSCYGPFRDKPCIGNFIEDQSYEEMRALCYEAKTNGTFPTLASQIEAQLQDARQKMSLLYNVSNETLNAVINLYNNNADSNASPYSGPNPFVSTGAGLNTQQNTNLFGSASNTANPFAQQQVPTTSSFGGGSSVFGGTSTFGATSSSVFGGNQSSVFGSNQTSAFGNPVTSTSAASTSDSIFGLSSTTNSPFSLGQIQSQPQPDLGNIFGNAATPAPPAFNQQNSVFGGAPSLFGNQGMFGGQQQNAATPASTSIFGQANQAFGATSGTSIFGNAASTPQSNVFGNAAAIAAPQSNVFGAAPLQQQQSLFGATQPQAPPQGLFSNVPVPVQQGGNIFGSASVPQMSSNIFGNAAATLPQTAASSVNPFGAASSPFGNTGAPSQPPQSNSVFGQATFSSPFGGGGGGSQQFGASNPFQSQPADVQSNETVYSPLNSIAEQDLNWFKADYFELGSIPTMPPPRELCT